jgi:hypothetical protein
MTKHEEKAGSCGICATKLNDPCDALSNDCGGDCWRCVGEIEAAIGYDPSLAQVRKEFAAGLRPEWIDPIN